MTQEYAYDLVLNENKRYKIKYIIYSVYKNIF